MYLCGLACASSLFTVRDITDRLLSRATLQDPCQTSGLPAWLSRHHPDKGLWQKGSKCMAQPENVLGHASPTVLSSMASHGMFSQVNQSQYRQICIPLTIIELRPRVASRYGSRHSFPYHCQGIRGLIETICGRRRSMGQRTGYSHAE
jgi:hypothetical protein